MLDEYRQLYEQEASKIKDWKKINKNTLCNLYVDEKSPVLKNAYFSAIVANYWYLIVSNYNTSKSIATQEDVYDWLLESILYALKHVSWRNPKSSIYQDPNGPDKVINRCMKCRRLTYYQQMNRMKRKDGFGTLSLDEIQEIYNENTDAIMDTSEMDIQEELSIKNLIKNCFKMKKYITAFIIDNIAYGDTFSLYSETKEGKKSKQDEDSEAFKNESGYVVFNKLWLEKRLKKLSPADAQYFANRYDLPLEVVEDKLINYLAKASNKDIKNLIKNTLDDLKNNFQEFEILDANRFYEFG